MRSLWCCVALVVAVGCAPIPVEVDVTFPREENFLFTDFGQLFIYDVDPVTGLGDCPALLEQIRRDVGTPILSTDRTQICDFRDGGVNFGDVPPGPHAYVVVATNDADTMLLSGCTVAEAYEGAPPVEIRLFPTPGYADATRDQTLTCGNAADKCAGGCR